MIESWIDKVVEIAGSVRGPNGGLVKAYAAMKRAEIPETIQVFPTAITYVTGLRASYSAGGVCIDLWDGVTEFHLFADNKKANLPELIRYFPKIRAAFAGAITLGGSVDHCVLKGDSASLVLVEMTYGTEAPHHGIQVQWEVKENVTGQFTVGG